MNIADMRTKHSREAFEQRIVPAVDIQNGVIRTDGWSRGLPGPAVGVCPVGAVTGVSPRARVPVVAAIGVLMALSLVAPHIGIAGQGIGRSLIPTGLLFSQVQASAVGPYDQVLLGLGINVGYLGIGLQQLSLVGAFASFPSVSMSK